MHNVRRLSAVLLLAVMASSAHADRLALVIGNAAYTDAPLKNPLNDARAVEARLTALKFRTTLVENFKRDDIGRFVSRFITQVHAGDDVLVFYAGHGLQVRGVNFFPAVDARILTEDDVALNSLNLNSLIDHLEEAKAAVKLLFLDACRNSPFGGWARGGDRGLARMDDAPSGTLIQYATRPGRVAADGDGTHGLYTEKLLLALDTGSEPVEQTLKRAANLVKQASHGDQDPWVEGHLEGDFCFGGCGELVAAAVLTPSKPAPVVTAMALPAAAGAAPAPLNTNDIARHCAEAANKDSRVRAFRQPDTSDYYPDTSRRLQEEGAVIVGFTIGADGRPPADSIKVESSSGSPRLDEAAAHLIEDSYYYAACAAGKPSVTTTRQKISFRITPDPRQAPAAQD